ncbi:MotA/TolQ/ExbB proton channel family protein [Aquisphaera insulae]|uniref:MotA/TolQ/ExbB proton channel family protein n=1 Tax=Aquisphaera insulae TaxID=2712864 RepID=UPI0013EDBB16|nr:MotA/TolQ/ExbB proton channel family protein [Aquisphaera insulae]
MNRNNAPSCARAAAVLLWLIGLAGVPTDLRGQEAPGKASDPPTVQQPADSGPAGEPKEAGTGKPAAGKPGVDRGSVLKLLFQANPMLWPLAACSIFTVGVALERLLALRRKRVVPPDFVDRLIERLEANKLDRERALELCRAHDSPAARTIAAAIKSWGLPGSSIRQVVSFDAAGEVVEMKRNLRLLSGMATIGPLLGLLGTVVGIIQSFDALGGRMGPSRGEALAQGISLALVATAFGLVVAIFSVVLYYYLLNRVDVLIRELDEKTRRVIDLVSAEAIRGGTERRHAPLPPPDAHRQEMRAY